MTISSRKMKTFLVVVLTTNTVVLGCQTKHPSDKSLRANSGQDFVLWLQDALRNGDRSQIIAATRFPVQIEDTMMDESTFTNNYDKVWNPESVKVAMNEVPGQFITGNKFIIGCGEVWFERTKDQQFKVTAFGRSAYANAGMSMADCYRVRDFVKQLQAAIASDHREQVAGMLKYPLYFHGQSKTTTLHNASETLRNYDLMFSATLRRVVAEQQIHKLMSQADGVAIGDGFIWISEPSVGGPLNVTSIFEPPLHY